MGKTKQTLETICQNWKPRQSVNEIRIQTKEWKTYWCLELYEANQNLPLVEQMEKMGIVDRRTPSGYVRFLVAK